MLTLRALLLVLVATVGCSTQNTEIAQVTEKVASLRSTAIGIGEAWLKGDVSGTYAAGALEETFRLLEKTRTQLHSGPRLLVDPRGAQLSSRIEDLSRLIALLTADVDGSAASSARQHLEKIATLESDSM
jgi:hypothetical protein